jgi:hypothetical protein
VECGGRLPERNLHRRRSSDRHPQHRADNSFFPRVMLNSLTTSPIASIRFKFTVSVFVLPQRLLRNPWFRVRETTMPTAWPEFITDAARTAGFLILNHI